MDIPCITRRYWPGEPRSLTLYALSGVMKSPGLTCADAGALKNPTMIASAVRIPMHCAPHLNARFISAPVSAQSVADGSEFGTLLTVRSSGFVISPTDRERQDP